MGGSDWLHAALGGWHIAAGAGSQEAAAAHPSFLSIPASAMLMVPGILAIVAYLHILL